MSKKSLDVLVIGAGPVGLFCANELIRQGLSCRIVDKKNGLSDKSKALGLHIRTLDLFKDCGFFDEIVKQGLKTLGVIIKSSGKEIVHLNFAEAEANIHFVIDLPQDKTEHILAEGLKAKKLAVEWETELTGIKQDKEGVSATLTRVDGKTETVSASWLIACDGGHSTVRNLLKMDFIGSEYKENWWLADLHIDWSLPQDQMIMYPSAYGPLACFPIGKKRYRLVMTAPPDKACNPTLEDIIDGFNRRSGEKAVLSDPIWLSQFYLHHRQIQHYRKDRVFFAGDAAHVHSPIGGQGLNTGIQDGYNLIWKLALVHNKLAKKELLETYHMERYPVGQGVIKKTDIMTKMLLLKNSWLIALRNFFLSKMMSITAIRKKVTTEMAELDISYAGSPIVANLGSIKHLKAGRFLFDFNLRQVGKKKITPLHEIVQGTAHHLLLFAGLNFPDVNNLIEIAKKISDKYPNFIVTHLILCQESDKLESAASIWLDENQDVHKKYAIDQPTALLIRPDKYIGLTQSPLEKEELMTYLGNIFK